MMTSYLSDGFPADDDGAMENWAILEKDASDVASLLSEPSVSPNKYFGTDDGSSDGGFYGVSPVRRSFAAGSPASHSPVNRLELIVPEEQAAAQGFDYSILSMALGTAFCPQNDLPRQGTVDRAQEHLAAETEHLVDGADADDGPSLLADEAHHDAAIDGNERSWSEWEETDRKAQDIKLAATPVPNVTAHQSHRYQKILLVGESGIGKTTFVRNLFAPYSNSSDITIKDASGSDAEALFEKSPSELCSEVSVFNDATRTTYHYFVQDTPALDLNGDVNAIVNHVEDQNAKYLAVEQDPNRTVKMADVEDPRVDLCLYLISPHSLKKCDIHAMRELAECVPVVPLLAKADSMTAEELAAFREKVRCALQGSAAAGGAPFMHEFEAEALRAANCQRLVPPFAIIASPTMDLSIGQFWPVRRYPWGTCEAQESGHSDVLVLRRLLFDTAYEDLKDATEKRYYAYREKCLAGGRKLAERCLGVSRSPSARSTGTADEVLFTIKKDRKTVRYYTKKSVLARSAAFLFLLLLIGPACLLWSLAGNIWTLQSLQQARSGLEALQQRDQQLMTLLDAMMWQLKNATDNANLTLNTPGPLLHAGRCKRTAWSLQHSLDSTHRAARDLSALLQLKAPADPAVAAPMPRGDSVGEAASPSEADYPAVAALEAEAEQRAGTGGDATKSGPGLPISMDVVAVMAVAEVDSRSSEGALRRARFQQVQAAVAPATEAASTPQPAAREPPAADPAGEGEHSGKPAAADAAKDAAKAAKKMARRKAKAAEWEAKCAKAQAWLARKAAKLAKAAEKKLQHGRAWAREGLAEASERVQHAARKLTLRRVVRLAARGVFVGAWV